MKRLTGVDLWDDIKFILGESSPICIDVGANKGQTIESILATFNTPIIHAFEPSSDVFDLLEATNFGNNVSIYNLAMGSEVASREFINYSESRLSSFLPMDTDEENRFREIEKKNVEIVGISTVDNFMRSNNIVKIDLLKIDTQGFDLEVLHGARSALEAGAVKLVLIEMNFVKMYKNQSAPNDIINFLKDHELCLVDYYEKVRQGECLAWCTALFVRS